MLVSYVWIIYIWIRHRSKEACLCLQLWPYIFKCDFLPHIMIQFHNLRLYSIKFSILQALCFLVTMTLYLIIVTLFNHICDFFFLRSLKSDFISLNVTLFLVITTLYLKIVAQLQLYVSQRNFISHIITLYLMFVTSSVTNCNLDANLRYEAIMWYI